MRLLMLYATTEGQTRRIAQFIAERAAGAGWRVDSVDAAEADGLEPRQYDAAIIAGSLHAHHYQPALRRLVHQHAASLNALESAFVSVSLAALAPGSIGEGLEACDEAFFAETGWRPACVHHAKGALRYTEYDFFKRWAMVAIAKAHGHPTDASHDFEFTDYADLARFIDRFLTPLQARKAAGSERPIA